MNEDDRLLTVEPLLVAAPQRGLVGPVPHYP